VTDVALGYRARCTEADCANLARLILRYADAGGRPMEEIARAAIDEAFAALPKPRLRDPDEAAEAVRRAVRSAIAERWNKKPICHVHVLVV